MNTPDNLFVKDAQGAGKWALDIIRRYGMKSPYYDPAIYWAARCACHWGRIALDYDALKSLDTAKR